MRFDFVLQLVEPVARRGDEHRAQREIYPGAEAKRGHHRAELPRLGERFDHAGSLGIGEPAVMKRHALLDQLRQDRTQQVLLLGRQ